MTFQRLGTEQHKAAPESGRCSNASFPERSASGTSGFFAGGTLRMPAHWRVDTGHTTRTTCPAAHGTLPNRYRHNEMAQMSASLWRLPPTREGKTHTIRVWHWPTRRAPEVSNVLLLGHRALFEFERPLPRGLSCTLQGLTIH